MTGVMCSPWKRTFTLVPLALLTMFSPSSITIVYGTNVFQSFSKDDNFVGKLGFPSGTPCFYACLVPFLSTFVGILSPSNGGCFQAMVYTIHAKIESTYCPKSNKT